MYYGFGALNVCTPIFQTALLVKSPKVSNWLLITIDFLLIFTVGLLFVELSIIKRSLKAENRVAVNVQGMLIHCIAFALYSALILCYVII
jgi:hypothetical protein